MGEVDIDLLSLIIVLGVILVSMTLHEAMHAFVGYWLGDDTAKREGRLTLNPIRHIDPFLTILLPLGLALVGAPIFGGAKPVPFNPDRVKGGEWGAALVALGGPLTNFLLAFIAYGIFSLGMLLGGLPELAQDIIGMFVTVNLGFFIFNILPIPPLDGSRVMYALAPEFVRAGMRFIERFGIILVFVIVLLFSQPLGQFMQAAVSFFLDVFSGIFQR